MPRDGWKAAPASTVRNDPTCRRLNRARQRGLTPHIGSATWQTRPGDGRSRVRNLDAPSPASLSSLRYRMSRFDLPSGSARDRRGSVLGFACPASPMRARASCSNGASPSSRPAGSCAPRVRHGDAAFAVTDSGGEPHRDVAALRRGRHPRHNAGVRTGAVEDFSAPMAQLWRPISMRRSHFAGGVPGDESAACGRSSTSLADVEPGPPRHSLPVARAASPCCRSVSRSICSAQRPGNAIAPVLRTALNYALTAPGIRAWSRTHARRARSTGARRAAVFLSRPGVRTGRSSTSTEGSPPGCRPSGRTQRGGPSLSLASSWNAAILFHQPSRGT